MDMVTGAEMVVSGDGATVLATVGSFRRAVPAAVVVADFRRQRQARAVRRVSGEAMSGLDPVNNGQTRSRSGLDSETKRYNPCVAAECFSYFKFMTRANGLRNRVRINNNIEKH
jgi:threonine dehydrogenase-like Zn-dependent dehydrogenase